MAVVSCFARCAGGKEKDPSTEAEELAAIRKEEEELMDSIACLQPSTDSLSPSEATPSTDISTPSEATPSEASPADASSDASSPLAARVPLKKDRHLVHRLRRTEQRLQQLKKRRDALQRSAQRRAVYGDTVRRLKASVVQLYHAMVANTPVLVKGFILVFLGLSGGRAFRG